MAGTEVGSLYYDLNIDDKNLRKQLDDADKSVKGFGDHLSAYWGNSVDASRKFGLAVAAVGAGVVAFGASSVKAFEESENAIAQTNAVLKSTGEAAGVTADQVTKLANSLQRQTKFSDEDVRSAENLLLTFTSIGKDIFPQATSTVLDMATALGEDTKSASIQLGKALQDPILGVTALRRVGVNFNQAQQDVIANLVNTGRSAEAQKLILAELHKEFGGSAVAAGDTLAGALAKLKNQFNDVQEAIGGMIAKAINPFLQKALEWFDSIGGVDGVMKLLKQTFDRIKPDLPIIAGAILGMLVPAFVALAISAGEFLLTMAPWAAIGVGAVLLFQHFHISLEDVKNAMGFVIEKAQALWQWFNNLNPAVQLLISPLAFLFASFGLVKQIAVDLANIFMTWFWPSLQALGATIMNNLWPALQQLWAALMRVWAAINPAFIDALKILGAIIGIVIIAAIWIFINVLNVAIQILSFVISVISNVIGWIANLIGWFGTAAVSVARAIGAIGSWFGNLPGYAASAINGAIGWFAGLPGRILGAVGNVGSLLYNVGRDLLQGMINGVKSMVGALVDSVKHAAGSAVSAAKSLLGIHSPSTVFAEIGKNVTRGFAEGIQATAGIAQDAMAGLSNAVISPTVSLNASTSGGGSQPVASPVLNQFSGDIHLGDAGAVDTFFDRLNRNTYLETIGVTPQ